MRVRLHQKTGYGKNATVWLLTVAFLLWRGGGLTLLVRADTQQGSDPVALLAEGLTACSESIDLQGASLTPSELGRIYAELLLDRPELFHVAARLSYTYRDLWVEGELLRVVERVYPSYTLTGTALTAARALYRATLTALLGEMDVSRGETHPGEAERVLWIHDLLADRYAYDTRPAGNADAYTLLRDGVGVCQAYALVFLALCRGAGLEADVVVSATMDHAWNHVRVDGVWYHVDVTRDDPIPSTGGREEVNHTRLLRSDGGMAVLGYHGYSCAAGHSCTDTRFESDGGGRLDGISTPLTPISTGWIGVGDGEGIVGVRFSETGIFVGEVGDVNVDGRTDPVDLLALYDPALPDAWRTWMREKLMG